MVKNIFTLMFFSDTINIDLPLKIFFCHYIIFSHLIWLCMFCLCAFVTESAPIMFVLLEPPRNSTPYSNG